MHSKTIPTADGVFKGLQSTFRKNFSSSTKLITNDDVKLDFLKRIALSGATPPQYIKTLKKLILDGRIVPVQCTSDFIKSLNKSLKGDACINPKEYEIVLGFYTGNQNRLYILMDNIKKILGSDNKSLAIVTLHELQHMSCYNCMRDFINTWSKEMFNFYAYFTALLYKAYSSGMRSVWNTLSGHDKRVITNLLNPDNGISYLVQYLVYNNEYLYACAGANISVNDCRAIGDKFSMVLSSNGANQQIADKISDIVSKFCVDIFNGKIGSTYQKPDNSTIIECLRASYKKVFNIDPWRSGTFIYQEMIFPSEIICISSQFDTKNGRYYKFLNYL